MSAAKSTHGKTQWKKHAKFCSFCKSKGKTEEVYTSHFVKDQPGPKGKVTCPELLANECGYCHEIGHTPHFCPVLKARDERRKAKKVVIAGGGGTPAKKQAVPKRTDFPEMPMPSSCGGGTKKKAKKVKKHSPQKGKKSFAEVASGTVLSETEKLLAEALKANSELVKQLALKEKEIVKLQGLRRAEQDEDDLPDPATFFGGGGSLTSSRWGDEMHDEDIVKPGDGKSAKKKADWKKNPFGAKQTIRDLSVI